MRKRFAFLLLSATLLGTPTYAADVQKPVTVPLQVTALDLQVFASAIRLAAAQCGADKEIACQIGMSEKDEIAKLNAAMAALQTAQAEAEKRGKSPKP